MTTLIRSCGLAGVFAFSLGLGSALANSNCPYPTSAGTDGCTAANPSATTIHANFFTGYAAQSGQTAYATRPGWNVAGVDYAVGYYTPLNQMIDIRQSQPTGCGLRAFGSSMGVQCTGSGALTIHGYRFDLSGGTFLIVSGSGYTSVVIDDNYFFNGTSTDRSGGYLAAINSSSANLTVTNNTFDGDGQNRTLGLAFLLGDSRSGTQQDTINHNVFLRTPAKDFSTGPCGDSDIEDNYFEGIDITDAHGEFGIDGSSVCTKNNLIEAYNTGLLPANETTGMGGTAAMLFPSSGTANRSWNNVVVSHNTLVANTIGGLTMGAALTSRMIEASGGNIYVGLQYLHNFMDPTGTLLCYYVTSPTPASTTFTDNVNLLNGSGINDYTSASCYGHASH